MSRSPVFLRPRHAPDRTRAPLAASVAIVATLALLAAAAPVSADTEEPVGAVGTAAAAAEDAAGTCSVSAKLVPTCGAFLGVGASPHGNESYDQALVNFEDRIDRTVDIVHYYATGNDMFPSPEMLDRANEAGKERLLLVNWRPTQTWRAVADGAADGYLADLADHIKDVHPEPFFLSLHAEPESEINTAAGSGMTATDFRDFFRHTVTELRDHGATSIVFVMNYMGAPHWGLEPWFETLYPGDQYVDWIAQDPFAFGEPPVFQTDFTGTVDRTYASWDWPGFYSWAQDEQPDKPMMLAEWGVDEDEDDPAYKPDYFDTTKNQLKNLPAIKAVVYWDHPGAPTVGETRVNSSSASLTQFSELASSRFLTRPGKIYLDRPPTPGG